MLIFYFLSEKILNFILSSLRNILDPSLYRLAFGRKYDDDGAEKSRFHGLLNDSQAMLLSFFVSDYIPFLGWIDKLTGMVTRLEKTFEALDGFLQEVLDEHLDPNRVKVKQNEEKDLVDLLLELKKQGRLSIDLTDDQIKAIILVCAHAFPF